jgi:hypothetical protein
LGDVVGDRVGEVGTNVGPDVVGDRVGEVGTNVGPDVGVFVLL